MQLDVSQNNLFTLNVNNNNNINFSNLSSNFPTFDTRFNPNLHCINVDDSSYSSSNWTNIDSQQYFDNNCTYNFGCTDSLANNYDSTATVDDGSCIYPPNTVYNIVANSVDHTTLKVAVDTCSLDGTLSGPLLHCLPLLMLHLMHCQQEQYLHF